MLRLQRLPYSLITAGLLLPGAAFASTSAPAAPPAAAPPAAAPPAAAAPTPAAPAPATPPAAAPTPAAPAPAAVPPGATPAPAPDAVATTPDPAAVPAEGAPADAVTDPADLPATDSPQDPTTLTDSEGVVPTAPSETPSTTTPAPDPHVHVPINIGLFPPLSINGSHRNAKIRNTVSAALGWSRVDRLEGAAVALGAVLVDEDAQGVTWSLGANITHGEHRGIQATQGYNYASSLRGIQAGAVNRVNEARGIQFGMINTARTRVRGVQFGLINYAQEADASFALIPVTRKGGVHPEVWTSDTAAINVGIRLPANYTYAFFAGAVHPFGRRPQPVTTQGAKPVRPGISLQAGMGYGGHLPVTSEVSIDGDISAWIVTSGVRAGPPVAPLAKARVMVSWQLRPRLTVWGGPTFNVMVDDLDSPVARPGYGWISGSDVDEGVRVRWWPGFTAGLRF